MVSRRIGFARIVGVIGGAAVAALVLSAGACNNFDRVPIPPPDEVGAASFPEGASVGGFDATFGRASWSIDEEGEHAGCGSFYRFQPDGTVDLTYWMCQDEGESFDEFVDRAAGTYTSSRGDYAVMGQQVWIRLVERDMLAQEMVSYLVEAEICGDRMTLHTSGSLIRSTASLPASRTLRLLSGPPPATADPCDVASFSLDRRTSARIGERDAELTISTDPGRRCSVTYVGPDGARWPAEGSHDLVADEEGHCEFALPAGSEPGYGTASVTVGPISRDIEVWVLSTVSTTTAG